MLDLAIESGGDKIICNLWLQEQYWACSAWAMTLHDILEHNFREGGGRVHVNEKAAQAGQSLLHRSVLDASLRYR